MSIGMIYAIEEYPHGDLVEVDFLVEVDHKYLTLTRVDESYSTCYDYMIENYSDITDLGWFKKLYQFSESVRFQILKAIVSGKLIYDSTDKWSYKDASND